MLARPVVAAGLFFSTFAAAQWKPQDSHASANLRGVHAVDDRVAWASGTAGTVLRTRDGGSHWQQCAMPPGAENLEIRGVWAWDETTAVAMSAGPGEQSRVYKTTDGCTHWQEETRNRDKDGFWDAVAFQSGDFGMSGDSHTGVLLGDPVNGRFSLLVTNGGNGWLVDDASCLAREGEAAFAASNSSVLVFGPRRYIIVTGGRGGPRALLSPLLLGEAADQPCLDVDLPLAGGSDSSGAFSISFRDSHHGVVVGGDFKDPTKSAGTAAWTQDGGRRWTAAKIFPNGYRSAVAWDSETHAWITVGTSGSDISFDDGKTWQRFDNENWNAISLPYAVGPNGRIGKLDTAVTNRIHHQQK